MSIQIARLSFEQIAKLGRVSNFVFEVGEGRLVGKGQTLALNNITAGVREHEAANRTREITPLCGKPKLGNKMDALAGA